MKGSRRLVRKLEKMKRNLETRPDQAVQRELNVIRNNQRRHIAANDTYASGALIRGLRIQQFTVPNGTSHRLVSEAPHSGFVEFGTGERTRIGPEHVYWGVERHYNAPRLTRRLVMAIKAWMMMKGITPRTGSLETSSYLIARQISRRQYPGRRRPPGTPAQPFFFEPLMVREHVLRQAVRNAVKRSIP